MIRFDKVFEQWAQIYKPLSHNPDKSQKQKAFYRIWALEKENEFVRNINTAKSPAMAYSTVVDAKMMPDGKAVSYIHRVYFMVKQTSSGLKTTQKTDDDMACECKAELDGMCQDFVSFLSGLRTAAYRGEKVYKISTTGASTTTQGENDPYSFPITSDVVNAYRAIDISSIEWGSNDLFKNGWWVFSLMFEEKEPRYLCINPSRY